MARATPSSSAAGAREVPSASARAAIIASDEMIFIFDPKRPLAPDGDPRSIVSNGFQCFFSPQNPIRPNATHFMAQNKSLRKRNNYKIDGNLEPKLALFQGFCFQFSPRK